MIIDLPDSIVLTQLEMCKWHSETEVCLFDYKNPKISRKWKPKLNLWTQMEYTVV